MDESMVEFGSRKVIEVGGCAAITFPTRGLNEIGIDREDLLGETVMVQLNDDGTYNVSLEKHVDRQEDSVRIGAD